MKLPKRNSFKDTITLRGNTTYTVKVSRVKRVGNQYGNVFMPRVAYDGCSSCLSIF